MKEKEDEKEGEGYSEKIMKSPFTYLTGKENYEDA